MFPYLPSRYINRSITLYPIFSNHQQPSRPPPPSHPITTRSQPTSTMGIKKRAANRGPAPIKPKKSAALGLIQPKIITTQPFDQLEAAAQKSHTTTMNDLRQFYNAALFAQEQAELKLAQENKDHQATKKHLNKRVEEGKKAAEKVVVQNEELRYVHGSRTMERGSC